MIATVCISLVSAMIGLAIAGLRAKLWAVLIMSLGILATIAVFARGDNMSAASVVVLVILALSCLQAGYLFGGLSLFAMQERQGKRSPRPAFRVRLRNLAPRKDAKKTS